MTKYLRSGKYWMFPLIALTNYLFAGPGGPCLPIALDRPGFQRLGPQMPYVNDGTHGQDDLSFHGTVDLNIGGESLEVSLQIMVLGGPASLPAISEGDPGVPIPRTVHVTITDASGAVLSLFGRQQRETRVDRPQAFWFELTVDGGTGDFEPLSGRVTLRAVAATDSHDGALLLTRADGVLCDYKARPRRTARLDE